MTGSQEHFALEGQAAFVIPQEDNDFKVFSKLNIQARPNKL